MVFNTFSQYLIDRLIDWLTAALIVSAILWFAFTQPVFFTASILSEELPVVSQARLKSTVQTLVERYNPRTGDFDTLKFTTDYLQKELEKLGIVEVQRFGAMERMGEKHKNLILSLGPESEEVFVIGAHYDAETDSLDAEGNASGVATLLELAQHLSKNQNKLAIKVQLVAYPLSQLPKNIFSPLKTTGSFFHAESLKKANIKVRMMVSLDSVGRYSTRGESQNYPYDFMRVFYPTKGDYISVVGGFDEFEAVRKLKKSFLSASSLPMVSFNLPEDFSPTNTIDHLNYQQQGFRSVLITDTAKYRELDQISSSVVEQLDYKKMALLVQGLYQVVMDNESIKFERRVVHQDVDESVDK